MLTKTTKWLVGGAAAAMVSAMAVGRLLGKPTTPDLRYLPRWLTLGQSALLSAAAWGLQRVFRNTPAADVATHLAVGMTLGTVGDVFMAQQNVPLGMAAFGAGHIAYVRGLLRLSKQQQLPRPLAMGLAWGAWSVIGAAGWLGLVRLGPQGSSTLGWLALPYSLLLASTAGVATGLSVQEPRYWPLAAGAVIFLTSDVLIAMRLFNPSLFAAIPKSIRGDLVWLTYAPAQMLLVGGSLLAAWVQQRQPV
jgi:hypothetical protein